MSQMSFSEIEYSMNRKTTSKQLFLQEMERIMPWERWIAIISPHYHPGEFGRPPKDIGLMLRMFMLQSWYNLSDEDIEDMCCEDLTAKAFLRLAHGERVPDSTTLMKFRHLLEEKGLCKVLFDDVAKCLEMTGRTEEFCRGWGFPGLHPDGLKKAAEGLENAQKEAKR